MAHHVSGRLLRIAVVTVVLVAGFAASASRAHADALLDEMVEFTGQIYMIDTKVPAIVIGALRDGEISIRGFGERAGPGSPAPDGDTIMRIGSPDLLKEHITGPLQMKDTGLWSRTSRRSAICWVMRLTARRCPMFRPDRSSSARAASTRRRTIS